VKLLADECCDALLVEGLRADGHDVLYMKETAPGATDAIVVQLAGDQQRVLGTEDKDFGELPGRGCKRPPSGQQSRLWSGVSLIHGRSGFRQHDQVEPFELLEGLIHRHQLILARHCERGQISIHAQFGRSPRNGGELLPTGIKAARLLDPADPLIGEETLVDRPCRLITQGGNTVGGQQGTGGQQPQQRLLGGAAKQDGRGGLLLSEPCANRGVKRVFG